MSSLLGLFVSVGVIILALSLTIFFVTLLADRSNKICKISGIISLIFLIFLLGVSYIQNEQFNSHLDKVCQEFGYNEMTKKENVDTITHKIECDNEHYIKNVKLDQIETCLEYDEWHDCSDWQPGFKYKNGTGVLIK